MAERMYMAVVNRVNPVLRNPIVQTWDVMGEDQEEVEREYWNKMAAIRGQWIGAVYKCDNGVTSCTLMHQSDALVVARLRGRSPLSGDQRARLAAMEGETVQLLEPIIIPDPPEVDADFAWDEEYKRVKRDVEAEAASMAGTARRDHGSPAPADEPLVWPLVIDRDAQAPRMTGVASVTEATELMDFARLPSVLNGDGVRVAVLDTGCRRDHPFLAGKPMPVIDCTGTGGGEQDENGHGTFVCSQIKGRWDAIPQLGRAVGVVLIPIQVLHARQGYGADSWIARGIDTAVRLGCQVISMSLGGRDPVPLTEAAMKRAQDAGVVVVVAAGNSGGSSGRVEYPALYNTCLAVGAISDRGEIAAFSNRGKGLDIWACGVAQAGATGTSGVGYWSGTSMATPHVSSAVAIFMGAFKEIHGRWPSISEVGKAVIDFDRDLNPRYVYEGFSVGIIQAGRMVDSIPTPGPVDPPPGEVPAMRIDFKGSAFEWQMVLTAVLDHLTGQTEVTDLIIRDATE